MAGIFDKKYASYYQRTFRIAWPCIIETLLISIVSIVDGIMVGRLGPVATAAVGVNQPISWLINSFASAISIGATVLVARSIGAGSISKASNAARQAVFAALIGGLFFACLVFQISGIVPSLAGAKAEVLPDATKYLKILSLSLCTQFLGFSCSGILRGSGRTKIPMAVALLTNFLNVAGNFLLIYPTRTIDLGGFSLRIWGAGMGVTGAAIATAFSQVAYGLILLLVLHSKLLQVRIHYDRSFRFQPQTLMNILKVGAPAAGEKIAINVGMILFQTLIANLGTIELSAHYLANIIESLSYMPAEGFALAATTLVGQSLGAENKEDAVIFSKIPMMCAACCGLVCGSIFLFFPQQLFSLFSKDAEVIIKGAGALQMMSFVEPLLCTTIVTTGTLRGAGDTKIPFYTSVIGMWGIRQLAALFFAYQLGLGLRGAWLGMALDHIVRFTLMRIRYVRRKWLDVKVRTE